MFTNGTIKYTAIEIAKITEKWKKISINNLKTTVEKKLLILERSAVATEKVAEELHNIFISLSHTEIINVIPQ